MYMRYILCIRFETGTLDEHIPIDHVTDHEIPRLTYPYGPMMSMSMTERTPARSPRSER